MTPTTKAGRALLDDIEMWYPSEALFDGLIGNAILAIEREAAAEAEALRAALERIRDFEATAPIDEWAEAAAFTAVQDIARAALATPAPAAPHPGRIAAVRALLAPRRSATYCANCGYRVTDDPGSCLRPDNHTAPAAPAEPVESCPRCSLVKGHTSRHQPEPRP